MHRVVPQATSILQGYVCNVQVHVLPASTHLQRARVATMVVISMALIVLPVVVVSQDTLLTIVLGLVPNVAATAPTALFHLPTAQLVHLATSLLVGLVELVLKVVHRELPNYLPLFVLAIIRNAKLAQVLPQLAQVAISTSIS